MHKNNFDFLRLCFALFVLITHSYVLAGADNDPLGELSRGQVNFASIGLKGFFIISGFLIFESLIRSRTWLDYMIKRILRIYPGLIVVLIACFFLGMVLSSEPARVFLHDKMSLQYLYCNVVLFIPMKFTIPGVFPNNHVPDAVNGSLWTIPYEFLCYVLLSLLFFVRKYPKLLSILLGGAILLLLRQKYRYGLVPGDLWTLPFPYEKHSLTDFLLLFAAGSFLASIRFAQFRYKGVVLVAALVLSLVFLGLKLFNYPQYFLLPLIIITCGSFSTPYISGLNKTMGDFSYGVYLYAFPVQQTLLRFFRLSPIQVVLVAAPIAFVLGALSWYGIEKRALSLKEYLKRRQPGRLAGNPGVTSA
jgi:peptidoglycan/LPS O-acetylase OafA/YrhL